MNKQKIILSLIGICAVAVPAVLLMVFTGKEPPEAEVFQSNRQIDTRTIKDAVDKAPKTAPQFPTPNPASGSGQTALPSPSPFWEGSPSAQ